MNIKPISLNDVLEEHQKYNTNNHWNNNKIPEDYNEVLYQTYAKHWIHNFHESILIMDIKKKDYTWMKQCHQIGKHTKKFPESYKEELDDMIQENISFLEKKDYFVRTENVSLKTGIHGVGPYQDLKQVIESMVTCREGHSPFSEPNIRLYFLPWIKIDSDKEFRVFVKNGEITAISQQQLYQVNTFLKECDNIPKVVKYWINIIKTHFDKIIKYKIVNLNSYVMDVAITENESCYFIEINPFGSEYSSGSALFHWILDHDVLNSSNIIEFRYTA